MRMFWQRFMGIPSGARLLLCVGASCSIFNIIVLLLIPQEVSGLLSSLSEHTGYYGYHITMIVGFSLVAAITGGIKDFTIAYASSAGIAELRSKFFLRISKLPGERVKRLDSGKMSSHIVNDAEKVGFLYGQMVVSVFESLLMLVGTLYYLIRIDAYFFFIILVFSLFAPVIQMVSSTPAKRRQKAVQASNSDLSEETVRFIDSALIYFPYSRQEECVKSFVEMVELNRKLKVKLSGLLATISTSVQILNQVGLVVVIIIGAFRIESGELTFASLSAFILYLNYLSSPLQSLGQLVVTIRMAKASEELIEEFSKETDNKVKTPSVFSDEKKLFEISDVPANSKPIFGNPVSSFQIFQGEKVLLLGKSGAGKTQLMRSIARLCSTYEIDYSDVLYDQNIGSSYPKIIYLDQEKYTIEKTVKDNFFHGIPKESFFVDFSFISNSGELSLFLSRDTKEMSRGERQRIALIRALSSSAELLLLDEPTSNLDDKNCRVFTKYIREMTNNTIVVASHDTRLIEANIWSRVIHI